MTRRNPTSEEQTHAADNAPLNPRLLQAFGDTRTEDAPTAPLSSISVEERQINIWPLVWLVTVTLSVFAALIFLFG